MGVLKNDIGRPSNKTIRTRFILKLIGLILVVVLAFIGGYKLSNVKKETKENKEQGEVKNNTLYLTFYKDGTEIDYKKYIK